MKVALIGSKIDEQNSKRIKSIISSLEKLGHKVDKSMFERTLEEELKNIDTTYKKNSRSIKSADVVIADTTQYSIGMGYLIAMAINERKTVLALHYQKANTIPSITLKGAQSAMLDFIEYDDDNLMSLVKDHLEEIKSRLDTKFILIISPDIDKYLKWAGDEYRMHKAQIVRDAIEDRMKKDKEYKEYLKLVV